MPRHILLVGDDARRLQAQALLPRAHHWITTHAGSCAQALHELERQPQDVVVADGEALGPDGVGLLATVSVRWPWTSRIAISASRDCGASAANDATPVKTQTTTTAIPVMRSTPNRELILLELPVKGSNA